MSTWVECMHEGHGWRVCVEGMGGGCEWSAWVECMHGVRAMQSEILKGFFCTENSLSGSGAWECLEGKDNGHSKWNMV